MSKVGSKEIKQMINEELVSYFRNRTLLNEDYSSAKTAWAERISREKTAESAVKYVANQTGQLEAKGDIDSLNSALALTDAYLESQYGRDYTEQVNNRRNTINIRLKKLKTSDSGGTNDAQPSSEEALGKAIDSIDGKSLATSMSDDQMIKYLNSLPKNQLDQNTINFLKPMMQSEEGKAELKAAIANALKSAGTKQQQDSNFIKAAKTKEISNDKEVVKQEQQIREHRIRNIIRNQLIKQAISEIKNKK